MSDSRAYLAFSIGPVQSFIAAARRTQDLFVGSKLLSHLAAIARNQMPKEGLIYPPASAPSQTITNKLLAEFASVEAARAAGDAAAQAVQDEWSSIVTLVRDYIGVLLADSGIVLDDHLWEQQTKPETALELYWAALDTAQLAALPGKYDPDNPSDHVEAVESMLAVRKLVRNFAPYTKQYGPMSSIGGERPALRAAASEPTSHAVRQFWKTLAEQLQAHLQRQNPPRLAGAILNIEGKEQLDAASTIKRLLGEALGWAIEQRKYSELTGRLRPIFLDDKDKQLQYPSTSDIAAADLRAGIIAHHDELATQLDDYAAALAAVQVTKQRVGDIPDLADLAGNLKEKHRKALLQYDGDLLFGQNISAKMLRDDYGIEVDKPIVANLIDRANKLVRRAREVGVYATSRYYAVVAMDGDRMGAMLRRQKDNHRQLSEALAQFAGEDVPRITEGEGRLGRVVDEGEARLGRVVYAGGEDVLVVFPLTTVLPAVLELMKKYRQRVTGAMHIGTGDKDALATVSAGIVIAHHLTPLDFVLNEARAAERTAKNKFGRNAVAVRTLRRSGQHTTAGYQFGFTDNVQYDQLLIINQLVEHIATDKLSPRLGYDFGREAPALTNHEMAMSELRRLFQRHSSPSDGEIDAYVKREANGSYSGGLAVMHQHMGGIAASTQLAEWLSVAEFIARGGTED